MELKNIKGTKDFMPDEQLLRQKIQRTLQSTFETYGYQPMKTPIICHYELLASKYAGGSEILKEVYSLSDQGKRQLGLRYDLTVPFSRVIGMNHNLILPFKRYEIGKVFRDGPVKAGRSREFVQCDIDIAGTKSLMAEAEMILMAFEVYNKLGLDIKVVYNNRKLLSGVISYVGINDNISSKAILKLDKLEKIETSGVINELKSIGIETQQIDYLFKFMKMDLNEINQYFDENGGNELISTGLKEINELNSYLNTCSENSKLYFSPSLSRGLEIYTGVIWEVFLADGSMMSSVGAGGRYDEIIGKFINDGNEYPAVGMTFGLDVIYEALKLKNANNEKSVVELYIIPLGTYAESFKIISDIRKCGIKADIDMSERKLKKSLSYADKMKIPYVTIIGENEIQSGKIKIKNMHDGTNIEMSIDELMNSKMFNR